MTSSSRLRRFWSYSTSGSTLRGLLWGYTVAVLFSVGLIIFFSTFGYTQYNVVLAQFILTTILYLPLAYVASHFILPTAAEVRQEKDHSDKFMAWVNRHSCQREDEDKRKAELEQLLEDLRKKFAAWQPKPDMPMIEYWKGIRDTIRGFDEIVQKYELQLFVVLSVLATVGFALVGFVRPAGTEPAARLIGPIIIGIGVSALIVLFSVRERINLYMGLLGKAIDSGIYAEAIMLQGFPSEAWVTTHISLAFDLPKQKRTIKIMTRLFAAVFLVLLLLGLYQVATGQVAVLG